MTTSADSDSDPDDDLMDTVSDDYGSGCDCALPLPRGSASFQRVFTSINEP